MIEPTLSSQLLGAAAIAGSFFLAGFWASYRETKKKELKAKREARQAEIMEQYHADMEEAATNALAAVEADLAERRLALDLYTEGVG